ncbi:MAG: HTH domain-containing protein [candidate division Zixibacteria bacterium]
MPASNGASNLLRTLILLLKKPCITTEDIIAHCGVSIRTAYRYLESLKKSGISISRVEKGFILDKDISIDSEKLTSQEFVFVALGLKLLEECVGGKYGEIIRDIHKRFSAEQTFGVEHAEEIQRKLVETSNVNGQLDIELSWLLLYTAIVQNQDCTSSDNSDKV